MGRKPILPQGANAFTGGAQLRQLRLERRITLKEMGERLTYSRGYLSAVENGKERLTRGLLQKYEEALGLTVGELSGLLQVQYASSFDGAVTHLVINASLWIPALLPLLVQQESDSILYSPTTAEKLLRSHPQFIDEKGLLPSIELALRNAAEQGLLLFQTFEQHIQYSTFLALLAEPSSLSSELRYAAVRQFLSAKQPDLETLNDNCNRLLAIGTLSQAPMDGDMRPYLSSFFEVFAAELYGTLLLKSPQGQFIRRHGLIRLHHTPVDIVSVLRAYSELSQSYTPDQFEQDLGTYTTYIEKTLHHLKLLGVVPKDRNTTDPELNTTFVPLHVSLEGQSTEKTWEGFLVDLLEIYPYIVLLGGPGSGKSTSARHLAWSHAAANLPTFSDSLSLLPGKPLPLRLELRRYSEERRRTPTYTFLSYTTAVLLEREGVEIHEQMFEILLKRGAMLLIFDGLDEAATLHERKQLVQEIEQFVRDYPGNRVLVTSRPVGYDLVPCPEPQFVRARVQNFNGQQIEQFLSNWYHHVLKLSSLSQDDQRELTDLSDTLKTNLRLRKLAENPLLLTVITALHRYERLPDKRVRVYDRCAELLLDTWARLRGTNGRWRDMKMNKDQQYACVAYLGFVLHERAQQVYKPETEQKPDQEEGDNDVSQAFLLQTIENFLAERNMNTDSTERQNEARRFCDLMLEEAGLIVERGTGSNGEPLYGFIHRTFQEYFAAYWIFDQFQENVSLSVIEHFLEEHLHDPNWHEVILLLLGKLNTRPVTTVLQDVLREKIKSSRSVHNNILQQALFFVGSCLIEEIVVQQELAQHVIADLVNLTVQSPFATQRSQAIELLDLLLGTQQYSEVALSGLCELARLRQRLDTDIAIRVALAFCADDSVQQEKREFADLLEEIIQRSNLINVISSSVKSATGDTNQPKKQYRLVRLLTRLIDCPQLSLEQRFEMAQWLYNLSSVASPEKHTAFQLLIELVQHTNIPPNRALRMLLNVYQETTADNEAWQQILQLLIELVQRPNLQVEEVIAEFEVSYRREINYRRNISGREVEQRLQGTREQLFKGMLESLAQRPDLQVETLIDCALRISRVNRRYEGSTAFQELESFYRPDLSNKEIAEFMRHHYLDRDMLLEHCFLKSYVQHADIPRAQAFQATQDYYRRQQGKEKEELAATLLIFYSLRHDATPEQTFETFQMLLKDRISRDIDVLLTFLLLQITQRSDISIEYASKIALFIQDRPTLPLPSNRRLLRTVRQAALIQWLRNYTEDTDLSAEQVLLMATALLQLGKEKWAKDKVWQLLVRITQDKKLSPEQRRSALVKLLKFINSWSWSQTAQIIQIVFTLQAEQEARTLLSTHWTSTKTATVNDIPTLIELAQQELLPLQVRNQIYAALQRLIPRFHELGHTQTIQQESNLNGKERG